MKNRKKLAANRDGPGICWTNGELNGELKGKEKGQTVNDLAVQQKKKVQAVSLLAPSDI